MRTSQASTAPYDDFGKLLLRLALAVLILFHGVAKLIGGVGPIVGMVAKVGMPEELGYLVYVGEVIAPLLVLFGVWTRIGALIIAINMVVAVLLVHTAEFFTMTKTGGWALELQGMFFVTALALVFLGAGRYSVGGAAGRFN